MKLLKDKKAKILPYLSLIKSNINESSIAGYVALTGAALNIPNVYQLSADLPYPFQPFLRPAQSIPDPISLAVPLKDLKGEVVGVLELINAQDQKARVIPFPPAQEDLVLALGSQAAVAISNALLMETLEKLRAAEKKRYNYHLEAIFQSVKDAVITLDTDLNILAINEAAHTICGLDPRNPWDKVFWGGQRLLPQVL
jgi:PAS domain-containing protein